MFHCQRILIPDINVSLMDSHGISADQHAFDHAVRVALHDRAIHIGTRVSLVCVADDEACANLLNIIPAKLPFYPGRKSCPAAPAQPGSFNGGDHFIRAHFYQDPGQGTVSIARNILIDLQWIKIAIEVQDEPVLVLVKRDILLVCDFVSTLGVNV